MIKLEELVVYQVALQIGDEVNKAVAKWPFFDRDTLGKQIVNPLSKSKNSCFL